MISLLTAATTLLYKYTTDKNARNNDKKIYGPMFKNTSHAFRADIILSVALSVLAACVMGIHGASEGMEALEALSLLNLGAISATLFVCTKWCDGDESKTSTLEKLVKILHPFRQTKAGEEMSSTPKTAITDKPKDH